MAFRKRVTEDYVARVAKEFGVTKQQARQVLYYGMRNLCRMIEQQEDLRLTGMGRIWIDKPHQRKKKNARHQSDRHQR